MIPGGDALARARRHAAAGDDEAAKQALLEALLIDPACLPALTELGALALASGHRSAARTALLQAVHHHPGDPVARVGLGNLLAEDGDLDAARLHYQAALAARAGFPAAHQGLARVLTERGEPEAEAHWQPGFAGHALVEQRYRGTGSGVPLLLLVSARGGNIATRPWVDDRVFAVTATYADFYDPAQTLPPHALVVNAIGDADTGARALAGAEAMLAGSSAPVVNPPARVRATGREAQALRLGGIQGVVAPRTERLKRPALAAAAEGFAFPLLLRAPGFHTGQHFLRVESSGDLPGAAARLPGDDLLAIEYLDARGADGLARKYRVMIVDGALYPLHLAISADWKVHYFTAAMAADAAHRQEERRFLDDMPSVLGDRAMAALAGIAAAMGLDYAGVDFALAADGSVLLFEANATMAIVSPDAEPLWDYRRPAIAAVQEAARRMLVRRAGIDPRWPCDVVGSQPDLRR
jgi:glutathione synthase/RimK-type ligase-like ATP-grasp enzyme